MKSESNKSKDFTRYKEKWGLADYSFRIVYNNKVAVVPVSDRTVWKDNEIRTVHNLIKRKNNIFTLMETTDSAFIDFENLTELLNYMLIKKIAL